MARLVRPLWQLPLLHRHCHSGNFLRSRAAPPNETASQLPRFGKLHQSSFCHRRTRGGLNALSPSDMEQGEGASSESESELKKSRNQKKREARRAVRWGMELASFSSPQIKRILNVASLEREVFEALMLVKRFGPDVREGKRRQYNYIGKLLREVEPELMEALILATRDGDWSRLRAFSGLEIGNNADEIEEFEETDYEEEEGSEVYIDIASRWFDGLINKDVEVTKEVYAIRDVDFDRQELGKLVRTVHEAQQRNNTEVDEQRVDAAILKARKTLTRFLRALARQISTEPTFVDV